MNNSKENFDMDTIIAKGIFSEIRSNRAYNQMTQEESDRYLSGFKLTGNQMRKLHEVASEYKKNKITSIQNNNNNINSYKAAA